MKEPVTVRRGILRFANDLRGHTVCLYEDDQAVVSIIKNRTSSSPLLMNELRLLIALLEQLDIRLVPRYIHPERAQPGRHLFKADRPRRCRPLFSACSCSERKQCSARVSRSMPSLVHSQN
jgi:hypothetical protein